MSVREDQLLKERGKKCTKEQKQTERSCYLSKDNSGYSQTIFIPRMAEDSLANPMWMPR